MKAILPAAAALLLAGCGGEVDAPENAVAQEAQEGEAPPFLTGSDAANAAADAEAADAAAASPPVARPEEQQQRTERPADAREGSQP